jgi:hypothetical protein
MIKTDTQIKSKENKMYVITTYNHKMRGTVFVSQATDKVEALREMIRKCNEEIGHKCVKLVTSCDENGNRSMAIATIHWSPGESSKWLQWIAIDKVKNGFAYDAVQW